VAHGPVTGPAEFQWLEALGVQHCELPTCEPTALLEALAARGCNQVLWECGPELAAAAVRQHCVQEVAAVIAPKLLGGVPSRTPLGSLGLEAMAAAIPLVSVGQRNLGVDLLWELELPDPSQAISA
jgi:diaminohydroxyphosphoribosylaminopyrimidine deaminase/5-amino-6-(5-phosphoribosylamino)uracil reductase